MKCIGLGEEDRHWPGQSDDTLLATTRPGPTRSDHGGRHHRAAAAAPPQPRPGGAVASRVGIRDGGGTAPGPRPRGVPTHGPRPRPPLPRRWPGSRAQRRDPHPATGPPRKPPTAAAQPGPGRRLAPYVGPEWGGSLVGRRALPSAPFVGCPGSGSARPRSGAACGVLDGRRAVCCPWGVVQRGGRTATHHLSPATCLKVAPRPLPPPQGGRGCGGSAPAL